MEDDSYTIYWMNGVIFNDLEWSLRVTPFLDVKRGSSYSCDSVAPNVSLRGRV